MSKRTIGWQKYEDVLENQLSSPLVRIMLEQAMQALGGEQDIDEEEKLTTSEVAEERTESTHVLGMSDEMAQDAAMASNYDCWVGHTNFDITTNTFNTLNQIEGVELLKVVSRYRFFIGIGRMFHFKNVRQDLEDQIL